MMGERMKRDELKRSSPPLRGRSIRKADREGGHFDAGASIQISPSLTLPLKGGGEMQSISRRVFMTACIGATLARSGAARAQFSTNRPIRIIVPFAPAGSSDVLARLL